MNAIRSGVLLLGLLLGAAGLAAQGTTVVLVRHAERRSVFDPDSPLDATGLRRAEALAPVLADFHPAALYTSELERTRKTLAPTAARLGLAPLVRSKGDTGGLAAELLQTQRGRTVIVCWHHDLMKRLARGLGVKGPLPYWSLGTYDWIWIVRVPAQGEATLEERRQPALPPALAPAS